MTITDLQNDIKAALVVLKAIQAIYPSKVGDDVIAFLSGLVGNASLLEGLHDNILDDLLKKK